MIMYSELQRAADVLVKTSAYMSYMLSMRQHAKQICLLSKLCNNAFIVYYWNALYDQHTFPITAYIYNSIWQICPLTIGKQDFGEGNNGTHDIVFQLTVHEPLTIQNFSNASLHILCYIIYTFYQSWNTY
jgi:hypothetical protein